MNSVMFWRHFNLKWTDDSREIYRKHFFHLCLNFCTQPKIVEALLGYELVQVSCGASHVLAVTNEREVFAWGRGDNGIVNESVVFRTHPIYLSIHRLVFVCG